MKDKEDDTVRYKNTSDSYENDNLSNKRDSKIFKTMKSEDNKNTIDKLYDCGDDMNFDTDVNNFINEKETYSKDDTTAKKALNPYIETNSNQKDRYNINMFQFIDDNDCIDMNADLLNKQKQLREIEKQINKNVKNTNNKSIGVNFSQNNKKKENKKNKFYMGFVNNKGNNEDNEINELNQDDREMIKETNKNFDTNNSINNNGNEFFVDLNENHDLIKESVEDKNEMKKIEHINLNKYKLNDYKSNNEDNSEDDNNEVKDNLEKDDYQENNQDLDINMNIHKNEMILSNSFSELQNYNHKILLDDVQNFQKENNVKKIHQQKSAKNFYKHMDMNNEAPNEFYNLLQENNNKQSNFMEFNKNNEVMDYYNSQDEGDAQLNEENNNLNNYAKLNNNNNRNNNHIDHMERKVNKNHIKKMNSTEITFVKNIGDFSLNNDFQEENNVITPHNMNLSTENNRDIELTYLTKLSKLKKENSGLSEENNLLKEKINSLENELSNKKKEAIDNKVLYDQMNFEYDTLNKKYENLVQNQKQVEKDVEKEKQMEEEISNLKEIIINLNNDLKNKDIKNQNEVSQLKQMMENLKIIHEQMKAQYDLLILKMNTVNQENFALKRELFLYQNNTNNSNNNNNSINNDYNNTNTKSNRNLNRVIDNVVYEDSFYKEQNMKENNQRNSNLRNTEINYEIEISEDQNNKNLKNNINKNNNQYKYNNYNNYNNNNNNNIKDNLNLNLDNNINNTNNNMNRLNQNQSNNNKVIQTITNSHRKFISNINQNDSSGVSALLKNCDDFDYSKDNMAKKRDKTPTFTGRNKNSNPTLNDFANGNSLYALKKYNNNQNNVTEYTNYDYQNKKNNNNYYDNNKNQSNNYINNSNLENYDIFNNSCIATTNNNNQNNLQLPKRGKISRTKSIDNIRKNSSSYNNITENNVINNNFKKNKIRQNNETNPFPSESNTTRDEARLSTIEKNLINLQKKREFYIDQYAKLPEHPKTQKDLNYRKDLKKIIDDLSANINEYKMQERNLKKNLAYFFN